MVERLARLAYWSLWVLIVGTVGFLATAAATGGFPFYLKVDPRTGTSSIAVTTDAGTGCQYILTPLGGIMPRTGPDGKQICEK